MEVVIFLSLWWVSAYPGYLMVRHWWTSDFDWTTSEHRLALFQAVLFGPFLCLIGAILLLTMGTVKEEVLKPKRVK